MLSRILIVDDHDDFREMVSAHLSNSGGPWEIFETSSGEEALHVVDTIQPQIVLMDILLPGMNGIEATELIHARYPECAVIVLTIFENDAFKNVFRNKNLAAYLGKSEIYTHLVPVIKKILEKKREARYCSECS